MNTQNEKVYAIKQKAVRVTILITILFGLLFGGYFALFLFVVPWYVSIIVLLLACAVIGALIYTCIARIKEIKEFDEDVTRKY